MGRAQRSLQHPNIAAQGSGGGHMITSDHFCNLGWVGTPFSHTAILWAYLTCPDGALWSLGVRS